MYPFYSPGVYRLLHEHETRALTPTSAPAPSGRRPRFGAAVLRLAGSLLPQRGEEATDCDPQPDRA